MTIDERIARLRALAVSTLAEKRLGVDLSPGEAGALADANSINHALILLERRMEQKRFTYPPLKNKPSIISGDTLGAEAPAGIRDQRKVSPLRGENRYRYPPPTKRASDPKSGSLTAIGILFITGVWSYLVAAIALQASQMSGGDARKASISLVVACLALTLGVSSAALVGVVTATVASRHRRSLQFFIALLGLLLFIASRSAEQLTGFRVDTLIRPYSLLIWLGVTLSAFTVLRRTKPVRQ